jgi:hypothetical protein
MDTHWSQVPSVNLAYFKQISELRVNAHGTKSPLCPLFNPRKLLPAGVVELVDTRDLKNDPDDSASD